MKPKTNSHPKSHAVGLADSHISQIAVVAVKRLLWIFMGLLDPTLRIFFFSKITCFEKCLSFFVFLKPLHLLRGTIQEIKMKKFLAQCCQVCLSM